MRKTTLKRTGRGFVRNLGLLANGAQPKFYLGHDKAEAQARLECVAALWTAVAEQHNGKPGKPIWDESTLAAATAIAAGEVATIRKGDYEPPEKFFSRVNDWSRRVGVSLQPENQFLYETGRADLVANVQDSQAELAQAIGSRTATGQNLHEAIKAFIGYIENEYQDSDRKMTDNGKTKVDQLNTIMTYVADRDLAQLDYHGCDDVFGTFRRRPKSKRYGNPMSRKSCTNYIGELGRFFKWLHLSKEWQWRRPEDFDLISRKPKELEDDVEHESKDVLTWTIEQLATLNEYATPLERVFLLLGLNCSYGADQSGRLRVGHLHLKEDGTSYIRRIRRKKKTRSIHLLWEQTVEGLKWALNNRKADDSEFVLVKSSGQPYWYKTGKGNRGQAIPALWARLLDRVRKDHPDFPRLPFNSLRDTSANMIRRIAGEEIASLHLAHKHQSRDENLGRYTNPVRKRHFKALRKLEKKLASVFAAAGPEPFGKVKKLYLGKLKLKRIAELGASGVSVLTIANEVGLSTATVYRHLKEARK